MKLNPIDCGNCEHRDQCEADERLRTDYVWDDTVKSSRKVWFPEIGRLCPLHFKGMTFSMAAEAEKEGANGNFSCFQHGLHGRDEAIP